MLETRKVLIWGKTYPELSKKNRETVCTGGCLEDGRPIRLYPVDLRYLEEHKQYKLYDWVEVPTERNSSDPRPESCKVDARHLKVIGHVEPDCQGWAERRRTIFADPDWHYECLEDLKQRQKEGHHSLGMVPVGEIGDVRIEYRSAEDRAEHAAKLASLKVRGSDLFGMVQKDLEFIPFRVKLKWRCRRLGGADACPGHSASVMDWGLVELGRRDGEAAALRRMQEIADLARHDLHLYMGNLFTRQHTFTIIGLWYPRIATQIPLF